METLFDFEKPIVNLEKKLSDLRELAKQGGVDFTNEINILEKKVATLIDEVFAKLTPWQRVQLSRHPNRPYTGDYIDLLFPEFMELHGDRTYGEDRAMIAGIASWPPATPFPQESAADRQSDKHIPILIIGHQKGRTTKQKMERNFGMVKPEGYRKAIRLMELAEKCRMPILTFIDTPGAYPGVDAEERGQSQAIAESIQVMLSLSVPTLALVIGEGGSGGALAIGTADKVLMQEYSTYSVISPESCASILWSDATLAEKASEKLKMYPSELSKLGVIDGIIPEPKGGAHRNWVQAAEFVQQALMKNFEAAVKSFKKDPSKETQVKITQSRRKKFRNMGKGALVSAPSAE
jgi:acetyl-CoA carboxylase carboxyl transferase subunit alpha